MSIAWQLLDLVAVPARPSGLWHLALDYVGGQRLLRLQVVDTDVQGFDVPIVWYQGAVNSPTADGFAVGQAPEAAKTGLLVSSAPRGALIGKIGGSTADLPDAANTATPYGTKRVFAVGSHCVINLAAADTGPLYLSMNDSPDGFKHHYGSLHVLIEEYLL